MLIERLLIALLFLLAGAVVVFDLGTAYFVALWIAAIPLAVWVAARSWSRRKRG